MEFRKLRADELEARVAVVNQNGCSVLIYKDARVDQNILDETVGQFNWQRDHKEIKGNVYCGVGIYDESLGWVWKWDAGAETYTEAVKGEASDSFKRACFNWGIGRELYTSPFIWFSAGDVNLEDKNGKKTTRDSFKVEAIEYEGSKISYIKVVNNKTKAVFEWGLIDYDKKVSEKEVKFIKDMIAETDSDIDAFKKRFRIDDLSDISMKQYVNAVKLLEQKMGGKE